MRKIIRNADIAVTMNCACLNINNASRALTRYYNKALKPCGLSILQFNVLTLVSQDKSLTTESLAHRLEYERTAMSHAIRPLTQQGLIRSIQGADWRSRVIQLTAKGRRTLAKAMPYWQMAQQDVMEALGKRRFNYLLVNIARYKNIGGE